MLNCTVYSALFVNIVHCFAALPLYALWVSYGSALIINIVHCCALSKILYSLFVTQISMHLVFCFKIYQICNVHLIKGLPNAECIFPQTCKYFFISYFLSFRLWVTGQSLLCSDTKTNIFPNSGRKSEKSIFQDRYCQRRRIRTRNENVKERMDKFLVTVRAWSPHSTRSFLSQTTRHQESVNRKPQTQQQQQLYKLTFNLVCFSLSMKKIVIKMKSFKKLINQDLLQLALIISLLKVNIIKLVGFYISKNLFQPFEKHL